MIATVYIIATIVLFIFNAISLIVGIGNSENKATLPEYLGIVVGVILIVWGISALIFS
jgi:hypothetical protein